jgi:hypothetical protein
LLGLPPAPEQVEKFVNDPDPNAWPTLIDELLKSPHYGERWGRHWLDVARYADSGGYETDIYFRNAWRYRDYVVQSFNNDKPYDRFVQEQIAGDELWPDDLALAGNYEVAKEKLQHLQARIGTGLYALAPQVHESNMDARKLTYERLTDCVDTTGAVFLGLTLGCARCHDHKFDPVTQADYYSMQAVFASSRDVEEPLINAMEIADFKQHYPRIIAVDEARRAVRLFDQKLGGRALTADEQQQKRTLIDALAAAVLAVPDKASSTPNDAWDGLMEIPTATVLGCERAELIPPVYRLDRGELARPREPATPALPASLARATDCTPTLPGPQGSRAALARWITRPDHPLTARVMVNRIWQWHFGRGLVATPNDFGKMGQSPTHPELLDWLAMRFIERGWSIKELHRLIMLSSTYQQASTVATERSILSSNSPLTGDRPPSSIDPDNRYLGHMNRRRLEAETLWDSIHAVAGTLNRKLGGRPVAPPLAEDEIAALRERWHWPVSADPADHTRRGMYLLVRRNFRFPMFEVFDSPVNSVSCPCRDVTTVAPQALWSLNNSTTFRQARAFADRLVREAGSEPRAIVNRAWQVALGRSPTDAEWSEGTQLLESLAAGENAGTPLDDLAAELAALPPARAAALVKFALAMFNLNEFAFID